MQICVQTFPFAIFKTPVTFDRYILGLKLTLRIRLFSLINSLEHGFRNVNAKFALLKKDLIGRPKNSSRRFIIHSFCSLYAF
jgi:hypothetical protein